jgi:hypothetical protein
MCCGQKRLELRSNPAQTTVPAVPQYVSSNNQAQAVRTRPLEPPTMRTVSPHPPISSQIRSVQPQAQAPISLSRTSISIRSLENSPIRVQGPSTGRYYEFSGSRPVQAVDARDASALLRTRFFRRA